MGKLRELLKNINALLGVDVPDEADMGLPPDNTARIEDEWKNPASFRSEQARKAAGSTQARGTETPRRGRPRRVEQRGSNRTSEREIAE